MVRLIAKLSPWLAPIPSAYFVARSSIKHLNVPIEIAIIIGVMLELLGIATVHTALSLYRWNIKPAVSRDKGAWEKAPFSLSVAACGVYFVAVIFLSVVLETAPTLADFAPIIFPFVAIVGAVVLGIIYQHEERVAKYARKDSDTLGIRAVYYAFTDRIADRIEGKPSEEVPAEIPALPAPQEHDTIDTSIILPVCELCGQEVASGNMGSHRRWHCEALRNNGHQPPRPSTVLDRTVQGQTGLGQPEPAEAAVEAE